MPSVGERFKTFRQFANASLHDIYGDKIDTAFQVTANHLASGIWMNRKGDDGKPLFEWQPLPRFAQIAPTFGIIVYDYDQDGIPDLHLTQNSYSTQPETGWWRGGLSQLLKGNGDGTFTCVPITESGLIISEDGKSSALVDLDGDQTPDIIGTQNNSGSCAYISPKANHLAVRLQGKPGNPSGIGSRLIATYVSGKTDTREVTSSSGYLSQQSAAVFLNAKGLKTFSIVWPDGTSTDWKASGNKVIKVTLKKP